MIQTTEKGQDSRVEEVIEEPKPSLNFPELPPADFKPLQASNEELIKYGFPPRPSKSTHPRQRVIRTRTIGLPMRVIPPNVNPSTHELPIAGFIAYPLGPSSWPGESASIQQSLPGCTNVTASWVVPWPKPPASAQREDGTYQDGTWCVTSGVQLDAGLQAGVVAVVSVQGGNVGQPVCYAYTAWLKPNTLVDAQVLDFPVNSGDSVVFTVCAPVSTTAGVAMIFNQSKQTSILQPVQSSDGVALSRVSGAWGVTEMGPPLADFNAIQFYNCSVGSATQEMDLDGGAINSLLEPDSNGNWVTVAQANLLGPARFWVFPVGPVVD